MQYLANGRVSFVNSSFLVIDDSGSEDVVYARRDVQKGEDVEDVRAEANLKAAECNGTVFHLESYLCSSASYKDDGESFRLNPDKKDYEYSFKTPWLKAGTASKGNDFSLKAEDLVADLEDESPILEADGAYEFAVSERPGKKSIGNR